MKARALYRDTQGVDRMLDVGGEATYIGRALDCAIRIDDGLTSRKHAVIQLKDDKFWVEDLGSSNGTYVNEMKIAGALALSHNDMVRCGNSFVRFELVAKLAAALAPTTPVDHMKRVMELEAEVKSLRTEVAEGRRIAADSDGLTRRLSEAKAQLADSSAALAAERQMLEDMRDELNLARDERDKSVELATEARDDLASRTRQLARAEADIVRAKEDGERQRRELAECARTRDASLGKTNEYLREVEQLREVIREQCVMLEEQRVKLMVLEDSVRARLAAEHMAVRS